MDEKDRINMLVKMLKLTIRCGQNANIELDKDTCKYLLEIIEKDINQNNITSTFKSLT